MIIFNKADDADLPEGGFSEKQVKEILEYGAIEKMYASGIFFVSSIMGLGGKNDGEFVDRFYRKTFRTQSPTFSDPEDIDYMSLYKYNIMPAQVKQNALDYCQKNENLIYVNSGLYCIEKEIENFASKHSSYNKCQMVLAFLSNVIDKTNARIDERTKVLKDARDRSTQELDAKTVRLQEEIDRSSKSMEEANGRTSKSDVGEYALSKLNYSFDATQLANMDADRRKQNFEENDFASKTKDYQEAKDKFWEHLKESSQGLFKRNIVDSVKTIANDLSSDFKDVQHSKDKMDAKEKELDQLSSEQILKYVSDNVGGFASGTLVAGGGIMPASASATVGASYNHGWNRSTAKALGKTAQKTITKGLAKTVGKSTGRTVGTAVANTLGRAVTSSMAATRGVSKAVSFGGNVGANFARSSTTTAMLGKNEGITQNYTNFNVQHALELLKEQMKRFEQSTALGMWDFAAYVLSEDPNVANNVAHSYLALTLGEDSYMSKSAINTWRGNVEDEAGQAKEITEYIKMLRHPLFGLNPGVVGKVEDDEVKVEVDEDTEFIVYPPIVTATTSLSGKELAYSLNFPQKSIAGLPVLECVEFGRNVVTYDEVRQDAPEIGLGNVFHMNHTENTKVSLSKKSLASHTFITGSTGSGKSNTVYHMLDRARKQGVKFLVVEPAKGEYKNVFGGRKDVTVLGTNPKLSQLLRINPFSFPENIHVLEHMDRLVEIFNVCWPMYAAMPAVLKNAVEKSYVDCGWDIVKSENKYGEELYPSFADVARNVKEIIDSSEYDAENKGAYKGSLLTRLQSLCNGINGMIFVADEIPKEQLFEENVIVDLSRVGSSETKSLIMGMMVLKLQEYRMSSATGMNAELNHITVLEEAHNLLRRTSNEQSAEGSNLLGKSVEMLSNAIAEMRTYGEGFIIADQAPGLMDMSVIRNTNTKIILRLPDQADRELVGRAANLNEDQITELAKLPCGVAAVYQNEWIQPVLCKVDLFAAPEKPFMFDPDDNDLDNYCKTEVEESLLNCIMEKEILRRGNKTDLKALKSKIIKSKLETCVKRDFMEYLEHDGENAIETLRKLIYDFLSAENAIIEAKQCNDIVEWTRTVVDRLNPSLRAYPNKQIDLALALILYEQTLRDASYGSVFCKFTEVYKNEGGVF